MMVKNLTGWQKQPDKLNIQGTIENAIKQVTKEEEINLMASGRTDSGSSCTSDKLRILKQIQIFQLKKYQ